MITITQHNALVLPIFIRLSTGAITHINWYYIVESLNRIKNILANSDIQQLEKTPIINLNGDNLGLWINRWIKQDTLKQELTNIRHQLKSLKNIEYYTDGSLANRTIDNNDLLHRADNTTVDLGAVFYTSNELGEFSVYSCLSLWPSSTRAEIVAIFLALLTVPENSNVTIYTDSLDKPIEVNIRRFILKILATGSILAIRKPKLYKEMKCIMKCNKKENWNHLFECQAYEVAWQKILEITTKESIIICLKQKQIRCQGEDFIRKVLQNILGITAKSEKFQKFQHLALEVKVETCLTIRLQKDFKISLAEAQTLMANILIRFILAFKELIWKPRCEQVILWEKREGIS
ncbi:unnamed protein product [Rhizophagus irregularis]|nr:unnamed protein product [Rhizophagus irregularis]